MPDPIVEPIAATPAPAPAAPVAAPIPAAAAQPPAATAEAAAPTPAPAPVATPSEPPSFLSDAKPAATPASPPSTATPDPAATPPAPQPLPVVKPTYEAFKLPDGVTLDSTRATAFTDALASFETESKADHAKMQALGQQMMDMFAAEVQQSAQKHTQQLLDNFNATRKTWRDEIAADPKFGGDNLNKTAADCGAFIEQFGGTADEIKVIREVFRVTGSGDHPAMIRMFARAAQAVAREGAPVPATSQKPPVIASRTQRRYGNSLNGSGA